MSFLDKYSQGLIANPGNDLSTSMALHGRHIQPQILDGLNGANWQLDEYVKWYGEKRIKLSLGGMSPLDYRRSLGLAG